MFAEIVSVGHEILMGEIVDTNSSYLAGKLPALGIQLRWVSQVGDDIEMISEIITRGLRRSDLILITGGLGPTEDDLTRDGVAKALGEEMYLDDELLEQLKRYFRDRIGVMPSSNIRQANLIASSKGIPNPRGTAPGWWVEHDGQIIVCMPGPPAEMDHMWTNYVRPQLADRSSGKVILTRTLKTFGYSEALLGEMIHEYIQGDNPYLGIYARQDGIHLRIISNGYTEQYARQIIDTLEQKLRNILGKQIWGVDDDTMEHKIGVLLREKQMTIATMESCTGGAIASALTDISGASDYFLGSVITYTNEVKIAHGVPRQLIKEHGAVSTEVALAMAQAICKEMNTDVGIGITGVAGPSSLEGKPPGTVHIAVSTPSSSSSIEARYPPQRQLVKRRATIQALLEVWKSLTAS